MIADIPSYSLDHDGQFEVEIFLVIKDNFGVLLFHGMGVVDEPVRLQLDEDPCHMLEEIVQQRMAG